MIERLKFLLAGKAVFTLTRPDGKHYTYRVNKSPPKHGNTKSQDQVWFVNLGTGYEDSVYMGLLSKWGDEEPKFRLTAKSTQTDESAPVVTFKAFLWDLVNESQEPILEFRHEGRCCVCARPLTNPESIDAGIGPECAGKV